MRADVKILLESSWWTWLGVDAIMSCLRQCWERAFPSVSAREMVRGLVLHDTVWWFEGSGRGAAEAVCRIRCIGPRINADVLLLTSDRRWSRWLCRLAQQVHSAPCSRPAPSLPWQWRCRTRRLDQACFLPTLPPRTPFGHISALIWPGVRGNIARTAL